jgi:hypothetical protein
VTGVVNFILDRHYDGLKGSSGRGVAIWRRQILPHRFGGRSGCAGPGSCDLGVEYYDRDAITDQAAAYGNLGAAIVGSGTAAVPFSW